MKIVIVSDLHANLEALNVIPEKYDQLWILGDLVDYGPNPSEVVEFARKHATLTLRGNHDYAIAFDQNPHCHGRFQELAGAIKPFTQERLNTGDREFLRALPVKREFQIGRTRFHLCHAIPSDPLFGYAPPDANELWREECEHVGSDFLFVGHTHIPFMEKFGNCMVVNPGSLGLPNNRSALACYALWEDGLVSLCSTAYRVETTIAKVQRMPVASDVREDVIALLRTGELPTNVLTHNQSQLTDAQ